MNVFIEVLRNIKELFSYHIIFSTGILLITGYFAGKLAEKMRLPSITGYIFAGLLLGESIIGMIPENTAFQLNSVTSVALGLIALTIGGEFDISRVKRASMKILTMTFFEVFFAFVFVTIILFLAGIDIRYTLILGAISTATAPAATLVIVRELRARGEFIDYLYGIVAFDDALCVILFSVVYAVVAPMLIGASVVAESIAIFGLLHALEEIFFSCIIGVAGGVLLNIFIKNLYKLNEILIISIAVFFLVTSITIVLNLSLLIANMVLGTVLVNLSQKNKRIFHVIEPITPPLFALFFIIAGTEMNISVFSKGIVIIYGITYILSRFAGKYSGILLGSFITRAPAKIRRFLGFCLFPQAGVAIGLVLFVQTSPIMGIAPQLVKESLVMIVNIVLLSVFINELVGPIIARFGITKGADL